MKSAKIFIMLSALFVMCFVSCIYDPAGSVFIKTETDPIPGIDPGSVNVGTKITGLQAVIDDPDVKDGDIIDLSKYASIENFDYNATINKALTLNKGVNLNNATLQIVSDGVELNAVNSASVITQSSLKIAGSSLNSLNIQTIPETQSNQTAGRGVSVSKVKPPVVEIEKSDIKDDIMLCIENALLAVEKFHAENKIQLKAKNTQLTVRDTKSKIKSIETDTKCQVVLEDGLNANNIPIPTVTGDGELKQIDMTAGEAKCLIKLTPVTGVNNVIGDGENPDFSEVVMLGTYQATGGVTVFKAGGLSYEMSETFSKLESDWTVTVDGTVYYKDGMVKSNNPLPAGEYDAEITSSYSPAADDYAFRFKMVVVGEQYSETVPEPILQSITVESHNALKTQYNTGEKLDLSGLTILGNYKLGELTYQSIITDYTLSPANGTILSASDKSVSVSAGDQQTQIKIDVTESHRVVFIVDASDDSQNVTVQVVHGEKVSELKNLAKTGWTFGGWYDDAAYTNEHVFNQIVTKDITIYVKWIKNIEPTDPTDVSDDPIIPVIHYIVRFNANGGSGTMSDLTMDGDEEKSLPVCTFTPPVGMRFAWWSDEADDGGRIYQSGASVHGLTDDDGAIVTFYAIWETVPPKVWTVAFNSDGGSAVETQTVTNGACAEEPVAPSKDGYAFLGWYADADKTVQYDFDTEVTGDMTLYAGWSAMTVYVCETGDDTNDALTAKTAVATLARAVSLMNEYAAEYNLTDKAWTIYVSGTVSGTAEISSVSASSLDIIGLSDESADVLDGNGAGTVLSISAAVPITIRDITICNGSAENGGGIYYNAASTLTITDATIDSNTASANGGGIYFAASSGTLVLNGSTVVSNNTAATDGGGVYNCGRFTMCDDSMIKKNTATSGNGGGVSNTGTMFMYGNAVIGDDSKTSPANITSATNCSYSNKAYSKGGGIYSTDKVYLGYRDEETEETLYKGIYYNASRTFTSTHSFGGGVYNDEGIIMIASGYIAYNSSNDGGGIGQGSTNSKCYLYSGSIYGNMGSNYGGAIKDGTFIMNGGTISKNTTVGSIKPAVASVGTFTMTGGSITENTGSGVSVSNSFIMKGGTISRNTGTGVSGSNINIYEGSIISDNTGSGITSVDRSTNTMNGGCITGNKAGGVVVTGNSTFTMNNGIISGNSSGTGGGVRIGYSSYAGKFIMNGGVISGNTSTGNGGGVYCEGNFNMNGGKISDNAAAYGGGVYVYSLGTFNVIGDAFIPAGDDGKNDVFLKSNKKVNITGTLSASEVAVITPENYTVGTSVLSGSSALLLSNYDKFSVTQSSAAGEGWAISNTGMLTASQAIYTVKKMFQALDGESYGKDLLNYPDIEKSGVVGTTTKETAPVIEGFTAQNINQQTIVEEGTTVITIYYDRKTITYTFDPNGGTWSDSTTANKIISGLFGAAVSGVFDNPTKDGFVFTEWSSEVSTNYGASNMTFTAQWRSTTHTITYHLWDETDDVMAYFDEESYFNQLLSPSRSGYSFDGWYEESDYQTKVTYWTAGEKTDDVELWAKWTD